MTHRPGPAVTATPAGTPVLCHAEPCPDRNLCLRLPAQQDWAEGAATTPPPSFSRDLNTGGTGCDTPLCSGTCHPSTDVPHPPVWMSPWPSPVQSVSSSITPKLWWGMNGCFWCRGAGRDVRSCVLSPAIPSSATSFSRLSQWLPAHPGGLWSPQTSWSESKVMAQAPNPKFSPRSGAG